LVTQQNIRAIKPSTEPEPSAEIVAADARGKILLRRIEMIRIAGGQFSSRR